ncbi:hypothetical protein VUR80DRAFT_5701 [Thermomyces stellatus]
MCGGALVIFLAGDSNRNEFGSAAYVKIWIYSQEHRPIRSSYLYSQPLSLPIVTTTVWEAMTRMVWWTCRGPLQRRQAAEDHDYA